MHKLKYLLSVSSMSQASCCLSGSRAGWSHLPTNPMVFLPGLLTDSVIGVVFHWVRRFSNVCIKTQINLAQGRQRANRMIFKLWILFTNKLLLGFFLPWDTIATVAADGWAHSPVMCLSGSWFLRALSCSLYGVIECCSWCVMCFYPRVILLYRIGFLWTLDAADGYSIIILFRNIIV